jgi:hypothetical protein
MPVRQVLDRVGVIDGCPTVRDFHVPPARGGRLSLLRHDLIVIDELGYLPCDHHQSAFAD